MATTTLDTVVLKTDFPSHGLRKGDIGAVVEVYSDTAVEVEFVTAAGQTQAVLTLDFGQFRPVTGNDILSVRELDAA